MRMSEDWTAITPPSSPQGSDKCRKVVHKDNLDETSRESFEFSDDWDTRMFCCMGEPHGSNIIFHENSYLQKKDLNIFCEEDNATFFFNDFEKLRLFGFQFDKGTALLKDMNTLFCMAKFSYMQLDSASKTHVNSLKLNLVTKGNNNYASYREDIVHFLLYLRNYIRRVSINLKYKWMIENFLLKFNEELNSFMSLAGSVTSIPDYIINYSAHSAGNKCTQPSYQIFHCYLDMKWLYITVFYLLVQCKQRFKENTASQEFDSLLNFDALENIILVTISDMIIIALKRFNQFSISDLSSKSLFTCTCVRELWRLLQLSTDELHSKKRSIPFWEYVNRICEQISEMPTQKSSLNSAKLEKYSCSNSVAFKLWLLKDLSKLYKVDDKQPLKSNYLLLESVIKTCISSEVTESQMRVYLLLIESILNVGWELRTEPLILLWEYFHKKLNSSFLIPGAPIGDLAIVSKSALGLITQLNNRLESSSPGKNADSFHLFLRLLGNNLRKWQDTPRFWNQLKGRIFSKFSVSKLLTLNETGLYRFISLFLTLVMTADLQVSGTLQSFLKQLPIHEMDEARVKLIWKAHMALILLYAEKNHDISFVSNPLLDLVENAAMKSDSMNSMRIFIEGFQDLVDCTNNLELGQYMFIGNWIPSFFSHCTESDASQFLDSLLSLINKLNSIMSAQLPVSENNQLILLHNALWEYVAPYLKKVCSTPSCLYQISDIAALLTTLSLKPCFSASIKNKATDLFTFFITYEMIDISLLCRYLGQISRCIHLHNSLNSHSITLIKGWLRCLILVSDSNTCSEDLSQFTNYIVTIPEIRQLLSETSKSMSAQCDYFETFLMAVQLKYSSLQDIQLKNKFMNQISSYFTNIDRWLSYTIKMPKSVDMATNIYQNVGQMFLKIPHLLYTKSKPNSLLQCFLDLLLLPVQVRNHQFKLNPHVSEAIKNTMYLYVTGLFKLSPENDVYIARCVRELITVYMPRFVVPKGTILTYGNSQFSLLKCFEKSENFEIISKTVLETLCNSFVKKRSKIPHQFQFQALLFFNSIIRLYKNENYVIKSFIRNAFERVCDVMMFCDNMNPCKMEAKDIIHFILDMHLIRSDSELSEELMNVFMKLSHEHLAFTAPNLFDLFEYIVTVAPDMVARFLPQFINKIKEVEYKRGVGFDRALRKGLERIEEALKTIRNSQRSIVHL